MEKDSSGINPLPQRPTWRRAAASATEGEMLQRVGVLADEARLEQEKNLKASAQVTDVPCKAQVTSETPCVTQGDLARVSPHAPHRLRRERTKRRSLAKKNFTLRMPADMRAKLEAKAAAAETYPSAYVLKLVAADLCLPIDEAANLRSLGLQEQIAALTIALNKQGGLFNQIAAALNKGQPCPLEKPEIDWLLKRHREGINAIIKLGFD